MATAGVLEYLITVDASRLNSGLASAEGKVKGAGNRMSSWAIAKGQLLGKLVEKAAASTVKFMKGSVAESMEFDKQVSQIAATMQKTVSQLKSEITTTTYTYMENGEKKVKTFTGNLEDMAREMGATTAFTAQQAAEALNYMALAGYKTQAAMDLLPNVLNLAAAGAMELGSASEMVTQSTNALGLTLKNGQPDLEAVTTLIDQMAATASNSGTTVAQLGEGIRTVGANARKLAGGTAELNLVLGLLADNGIQAAEGGTALRNIITKLGNPANKAAKELKKLGVDVYDKTSGKMRGLADIFGDLNTALDGMSDAERAGILGKAFDLRDIRSIEALLGTSKDKWDKLYKAISDSKDAAAQMADTQLDNLAGDVTKFKSALGEAKLTIVEGLTPSLRNFVKAGTNIVSRLTNAFKKRGLRGAIEEADEIFKKFITNLKKSDNPVLQKLGSALELVRNIGKEVWGLITDFPGKLKEWKESDSPGLNALADILGTVRDAVDVVIAAFNGGLPGAIEKLREIDTPLSNLAASGLEIFKEVCEFVAGRSDLGGIIETIAEGFLLFKGLEIGGSLLAFVTKLSMLGNIRNIAGLKDLIGQLANGGTPTTTPVVPPTATPPVAAAPTVGTGATIWSKLAGAGTVALEGLLVAGVVDSFVNLKKTIEEATKQGAKRLEETKQFEEETAGKAKDTELAGIWETLAGYSVSGFGDKSEADTLVDWANRYQKWMSDMGDDPVIDKLVETLSEDTFGQLEGLFNDIADGVDFSSEEQKNKLLETIDNVKGEIEQALAKEDMETPVNPVMGDSSALESSVKNLDLSTTVSLLPKFFGFGQAKGNWYVPYDNYPSLLHRGEMVLNKSQARQFRDGEGGGSMDVGSSIAEAVSAAMSKVYVMMSGEKVGDLTTKRVRKNINATTFNKLRAMGG